MSVRLIPSQYNAFVELPRKSLEELKDMLNKAKEKQELYNTISTDSFEEDYSIEVEMKEHYLFMSNLRTEIMRQEEKLGEKTNEELKEIAESSARRAKQMENYEWDVVEQSSEDNIRGFLAEVDYLERLEATANFELQRREFGFA